MWTAEDINVRGERLENLVGAFAEKQAKLDDVIVLLVEAQIRTEERFQQTDKRFAEIAQRFEETDRRIRETDVRMEKLGEELRREAADRGRVLDERISNLVSAMGEFIRQDGGKKVG